MFRSLTRLPGPPHPVGLDRAPEGFPQVVSSSLCIRSPGCVNLENSMSTRRPAPESPSEPHSRPPAPPSPAGSSIGSPTLASADTPAQIPAQSLDPLAHFHPVTAAWFRAVFEAPTAPQRLGWPVIARGESALILAPTGTGKTLTAFVWCLDRLMLEDRGQGTRFREERSRSRIVYVSPLKAL